METKANYTLIGSFVLIFIIGLFCFVLWFSRFDFQKDKNVYMINFTGSVTGLRVGETARFHGLPIGTIKHIAPSQDDPQIIQVKVTIDNPELIREDSIATIEPQGLTGFTYIQIEGGSGHSPYLTCRDGDPYPVLQSKPSRIEEFFKSAPHIISNLGNLSARLDRMLDDKALTNFNEILSNVADVTKNLGSGKSSLKNVFADAKQTMRTFHDTLEKLNQQIDPVGTELTASLSSFQAAVKNFQQTTHHVNELLGDNQQNINDLLSSGSGSFSSLVNDTRTLIFNINRLLKDLDRGPTNFLTKSSDQGYRP